METIAVQFHAPTNDLISRLVQLGLIVLGDWRGYTHVSLMYNGVVIELNELGYRMYEGNVRECAATLDVTGLVDIPFSKICERIDRYYVLHPEGMKWHSLLDILLTGTTHRATCSGFIYYLLYGCDCYYSPSKLYQMLKR